MVFFYYMMLNNWVSLISKQEKQNGSSKIWSVINQHILLDMAVKFNTNKEINR